MISTKIALRHALALAILSLQSKDTYCADHAVPAVRNGGVEAKTTENRGAGETPTILLRGVVVDEDGAPARDVEVVDLVSIHHPPRLGARTDAAGSFALVLPADSRRSAVLLTSDADGGRLGFLNYEARKGGSSTPVRIVLRKAREMAVTVTDREGRPVADATVTTDWRRYALTLDEKRTDAQGKATLRVPVEPVKLILQPATRVHGTITVRKDNQPMPKNLATLR